MNVVETMTQIPCIVDYRGSAVPCAVGTLVLNDTTVSALSPRFHERGASGISWGASSGDLPDRLGRRRFARMLLGTSYAAACHGILRTHRAAYVSSEIARLVALRPG